MPQGILNGINSHEFQLSISRTAACMMIEILPFPQNKKLCFSAEASLKNIISYA